MMDSDTGGGSIGGHRILEVRSSATARIMEQRIQILSDESRQLAEVVRMRHGQRASFQQIAAEFDIAKWAAIALEREAVAFLAGLDQRSRT